MSEAGRLGRGMTQTTNETAATLRGVCAGYDGKPVVTEVSARLPRAAVTAIVGPNGAGKSTLLGAVAGVVRTTAGSVELPSGGRPALVVQQSAVPERLPITVLETVRMGRWPHRGPWRRLRREDHDRVAEALERLGIADLADRRLSSLSGGQRQRTLVAQGLVQDSPLLLLDEPAAGLDVAAQEVIADALREAAARGTTTVHVTHDLAAPRTPTIVGCSRRVACWAKALRPRCSRTRRSTRRGVCAGAAVRRAAVRCQARRRACRRCRAIGVRGRFHACRCRSRRAVW
ncbi:zinc ABC transporter ATP-binding protein AztA [Saccharomonospora sp. CUA-673]|uniref:zinc ABC transporter ATP-binding protein AztA n=1 Tax=Saccharomonospora sp. CUA-673 TaxID=1904969 RepID=UPI003517BD1F